MLEKIFKKVFFIYLFMYPIIPSKGVFAKAPFSDILLLIFMGVFFIKSISSKEERMIFKRRIQDLIKDSVFVTMMLAVIIMAISSSYATSKTICFTEAFRFFSYIVLYVAIKYEFNLSNNFSRYYLLISTQCAIVFLGGIIQKFTGWGVTVSTNGTLRMDSTINYPTAFAAYIVIMIFPLIMFAIKSKNKKIKVISAINIIIGLISLVLSWSRNGWLALVLGIVVLAIVYNYKFIYGIIGIGGISVLMPFIRERLIQLTSSEINGGRVKLWKIALKMIKEHPIRGVGAGNYVYLVDSYFEKYPELYAEGHEGFPTHNSYLKEWSEIGFIGMVVFFSSYVILTIRTIKSNRFYSDKYLGLTTAVIASIFAFLFINLFDNMMFTPKVMTSFIMLVSLCTTIDSKAI